MTKQYCEHDLDLLSAHRYPQLFDRRLGEMKKFSFRGTLPCSKSILNRLLILKSHKPSFEIEGDSNCDDVNLMKKAFKDLEDGMALDCGSAGTTFRFLAMRVSRLAAQNFLRASTRLLTRPHDEMLNLLQEFQVEYEMEPEGLFISSGGWRPRDLTGNEFTVQVDCSRSSQFASSVLINSWELPFDIKLVLTGAGVSLGYFHMTKEMVTQAGMQVQQRNEHEYLIPANQQITAPMMRAEIDLSSAFAIAALAAAAGDAEIQFFPSVSLQPDFAFVEILRNMGAGIQLKDGSLCVKRPEGGLRAVEVDLRNCPDLFPVLSVLCALADGESRLHGAPQLAFKESDRIGKSAELVRRMGRKVETSAEGMLIHGSTELNFPWKAKFDPDQDHRLAMAASIAQAVGAKIEITDPTVVNKSFPEFWQIYEKSFSE